MFFCPQMWILFCVHSCDTYLKARQRISNPGKLKNFVEEILNDYPVSLAKAAFAEKSHQKVFCPGGERVFREEFFSAQHDVRKEISTVWELEIGQHIPTCYDCTIILFSRSRLVAECGCCWSRFSLISHHCVESSMAGIIGFLLSLSGVDCVVCCVVSHCSSH